MEETIDTSKLSVQEKISILIEDLPDPIKRFVQSSERDTISLKLSQKYNLHVDEAGTFDQAYIFMLLGIYTPDEFVTELRNANLNSDTIRGLTNDVNDMVFKKLREEEQSEVQNIDQEAENIMPVIENSVESSSVTTRVDSTFHIENESPVQILQPTQIPHRTMQQDMALVQQGNLHDAELGVMPIPSAPTYTASAVAPTATYAAQPQSLASAPYVPPTPTPAWHASPAASFQTASIPNTALSQPIEHIPASVPSPVFTPPAQPFQPAQTSEAQQPSQPFAPLTKQYGSDPYREIT
jgi:hypothetical protein